MKDFCIGLDYQEKSVADIAVCFANIITLARVKIKKAGRNAPRA